MRGLNKAAESADGACCLFAQQAMKVHSARKVCALTFSSRKKQRTQEGKKNVSLAVHHQRDEPVVVSMALTKSVCATACCLCVYLSL